MPDFFEIETTTGTYLLNKSSVVYVKHIPAREHDSAGINAEVHGREIKLGEQCEICISAVTDSKQVILKSLKSFAEIKELLS